jgi:hypothetical protein
MNTPSGLRFNGDISIPTVLTIVGACVALGSAVAVAQTTANEALAKTEKYESVPERLATLEANAKTQADTLKRIENKIDNLK